MPAPKLILDLVQRFEDLEIQGELKDCNEARTRNEFINPFFEALGWDIRNERCTREVVLEECKQAAKQTMYPDYTFCLAAKPKFFVEAKRPSVPLPSDQNAAFQLRRYGYSAGLSLSILTNFAYLAIYDCRIKPNIHDPSTIARWRFYHYKQYEAKWDEIASLFAQEAVSNGSLNQFETENKPKRNSVPIEKAFLVEINKWRERLAHGFFTNEGLSQTDLNFAVQMTLNRLIFLRICEDHGIEPYRNLQKLLPKQDSPPDYAIYPQICLLFQDADLRYNAGLFHFSPQKGHPAAHDALTLNLTLSNETLIPIIEGLDPELCPYAFQVIPVEILGQIYEQFLGKVITMTSNGVEVVDKPEVRKAGGVYYTPQYIVDYIVSQTLGKFLGDKTPENIVNLTILDPACGSGSFLLGAYRYLLAWYEQWYQENDAAKGRKQGFLAQRTGKLRLTLKKRGEILRDHIFGVDKDAQAVEVAKFSLFLKYLEEENESIVQNTAQRLLPDLDENIKCGNSLIETDFKTTDSAELQSINPFDWETEFPQIMATGGFDIVIGNPPYVRQETLGKAKSYFQQKYRVYHGVADLYTYFIERGFSLLKSNGLFGYIVANKWFRANYAEALRCWLKAQNLQEIIDFGDLPIFQGATTYPCILILRKAAPQPTFFFAQAKTLDFTSLQEHIAQEGYYIQQTNLNANGWTLKPDQTQLLLAKLRKVGVSLHDYTQGAIYSGVKTGLNAAFVIDEEIRATIVSKKALYRGILTGLNAAFVIDEKKQQQIVEEDAKSAELIKPFISGRGIKRYHVPQVKEYLILIPLGWTRNNSANADDPWLWLQKTYPAIASQLAPFAKAAQKRYDKGDYWWELRSCDYYAEFEKPKIMFPDISLRGNFVFDAEGKFYCANTAYIISSTEKYLLGVLNSRLITFYYSNLAATYRGGYLRFIYQYISQIPIRVINFANPHEKFQHDQLVSLVEKMLELHKETVEAKNLQQKTILERQIYATDQKIDALVYELYGLTAEEIALVEASQSTVQ